ncbi:MAG: deoxyhypusine synthase family protein [Prevotellaceae bacterium]|jgi:hypothetical protein|nr:deoxyhypusine synthase family protein [Prevotellaceae bacterium]
MKFGSKLIEQFRAALDERSRNTLNEAVKKIVEAKKRGGKVMVVTGSGPNIHEGVTTLIAELIHKGIIDAVSTSSAVISHEMGGSLDKVKRVNAEDLGMDMKYMPRGDLFEFTVMSNEELNILRKEMILDEELMKKADTLPIHSSIIKAAGNMAYPMGLRGEVLASEILELARMYGKSFEEVAALGCDPMTMLGAGAAKGVPVIVTIPQLIGGGMVGMSIGDSIPLSGRSMRLAKALEQSDVIIESAVALTQEIHDGPFECYTGHGIWAWWRGEHTYNLKGKSLVRFDLDENLRKAADLERSDKTIQEAIDKGLPKTKVAKIPFRMEMSAFARHEGSLPVIGDIGKIWPALACEVAQQLGIELDFVSASQDTLEGQAMREWIVDNVKPLDRNRMLKSLDNSK